MKFVFKYVLFFSMFFSQICDADCVNNKSSATKTIAASIAIIATTIKSSIRVNPLLRVINYIVLMFLQFGN